MWWGWRGMGAIGCHETGCMNPPPAWHTNRLTGADCISYPLFSSPVFFWFQIIFIISKTCCQGTPWRFPGDIPPKYLWGRQIFGLHFPIDLLSRGWMTGDIMWSGGAGLQLLTGVEKSRTNATFVRMHLSSSLRTHIWREKGGGLPIGLLSKVRRETGDTLWSVRAGQLVSVVAPSHTSD